MYYQKKKKKKSQLLSRVHILFIYDGYEKKKQKTPQHSVHDTSVS